MQLNIPILVGAALADSINPVTFGVLLLLLSSLEKNSGSKQVYNQGIAYTAGFFCTSLFLGILLLPVLYVLSETSTIMYPLLGAIIFITGLIELFKHFRPQNWLFSHTILNHSARKSTYSNYIGHSPTSAFLLGTLVGIAELPFSRGIYLATLSLLNITLPAHSTSIMLALYNIIVISPLILITLTTKEGLSTKQFQLWQHKYHAQLHIGIGLLLVILGLWLVTSPL